MLLLLCVLSAAVPYEFEYGDDVPANGSVLFDLDRVMADRVTHRLDHINWFNRNFGVAVLELILYTPYSDPLTQVSRPPHALLGSHTGSK